MTIESINENMEARESKHPLDSVETIVVDPDDVVETMRRNERDETEQRDHVLRVSPPFEGVKKAKTHITEPHTFYPSEMDPKPVHFVSEVFLVGHGAGSRHPDWRNGWGHPNRHDERAQFRDEFDYRGEHGENRPLTDEEKQEWDEWWENVIEMWEDRVRHALKNTDEITLTSQYPNVEDTTVAVEWVRDD
jgi:hypothetical protein